MYYPRKVLNQIRPYLDQKEIIVLTGMRRVGKTTIYRMLFEEIKSTNKIFLDLENPLNQKIFEETNYDNVWLNLQRLNINPKEKAYVFLDEIGAMPQIVKVIKYLFDHYQIKFFLTGSSSFYLKNLFPESLAGRKITFELYPLDFEEFLVFKEIKESFNQRLKEKDENKKKNKLKCPRWCTRISLDSSNEGIKKSKRFPECDLRIIYFFCFCNSYLIKLRCYNPKSTTGGEELCQIMRLKID